jgi:hypothetical protein
VLPIRGPHLTRRHFVVAALTAPSLVGFARTRAALAGSRPAATAFALALPDPGSVRAASSSWIELPPVEASQRFHLAGVRWRQGARAPRAVQVRARRRGGRWTEWLDTPTGEDHAPDSRPWRASDPVWTGAADMVQVRTRGARVVGLCASHGVLAPGRAADFVVLDSDPRTADPSRIGAIQVERTYRAGRCVADASSATA